MWRQRNSQVRFRPKDGMAVLVRARVGLYEPRGEYQLLMEHLEEAGEGALKREFEKLKARLAAEGLFAVERKRALPAVPRRIGVVTSPTGAAIHDVLRVLRAGFPQLRYCSIPPPSRVLPRCRKSCARSRRPRAAMNATC